MGEEEGCGGFFDNAAGIHDWGVQKSLKTVILAPLYLG